jgi:hypothetical protein
LKQEGSVSAYNAKFTSYATVLDWNDTAKLSVYKRGVNDDLKDSLAEHLDLLMDY